MIKLLLLLLSRAFEPSVLPTLRELGIGLTADGVLGRGLTLGHWNADRAAGPGDMRSAAGSVERHRNAYRDLGMSSAVRR